MTARYRRRHAGQHVFFEITSASEALERQGSKTGGNGWRILSGMRCFGEKRRRWLVGLVAAALLAGSIRADAHHSFAAGYDSSWPLDLAGTVAGVAWRNPHIWLLLDVPGRHNVVRQWAVQFGPPNTLEARGLNKKDLQPGSKVRIRGYRSKGGNDVAYSVELTLSDGRVFRTGGALDCPTVSPGQFFGQGVPGLSGGPR